MAPKMLGGSKAFSKKEKRNLLIANAALWGGAGIPFLNILTDNMAQKTEMNPVAAKALTNGLFDMTLYALSGEELDVNMSDRVGNAEFYQQIWDSLVGDKEALEVLGGASGGRAKQVFGALTEPLYLLKAGMESDPNAWTDTGLRMLAGFSSGANSWFKFHLALKHGQIFSRNGKALAGITKPEAFAMVLGLPPQSYARIGENFDRRQDKDALIKEYESLYIQALKAQDNATTEAEYQAAVSAIEGIGVFAAEEGFDIQTTALSRAMNSTTGKTMYDKFQEQYYKDKISGMDYNQNAAREAERQKRLQEKE